MEVKTYLTTSLGSLDPLHRALDAKRLVIDEEFLLPETF
jgi:hypothetical protein